MFFKGLKSFVLILMLSLGSYFVDKNVAASTFVGSYKFSGADERTRDVLVYSNCLYMANMYLGLRTVDISKIDNPVSIDHYFPGGGREAVELERIGNVLFMADREGGTKIFDISNAESPIYLTSYPTYDKSSRIATRGMFLFVADRLAGLVVVDISDPNLPTEVGKYQRPYETQGLSFKDEYAFVANPWHGFYVLDITNLNSMEEIAYYEKPEGTYPGIWDVGIKGDYAYALCQNYGVQVIDISEPYSPQYVSELLLPDGSDPFGGDAPPLDIEFVGNYAAVSNGFNGVYILDINSPENPFIAEHIDTPGYANGLKASGEYLFIADGYSGVQIYDISEYAIESLEDAEDDTVSGWDVYDDDPPGAVISNVFDSGRQSRVIQFTGSGHSNGYRLRNDDLSKWKNTSQFVLEWSVKFSEFFTVYIEIETTVGRRYLTYRPLNYDSLGDGRYVYYGLGSSAADGQWHTFTRDLQADLEAAQHGVSIVEVNSLLIRGSGKLDDIRLMYSIPPTADFDGDAIGDSDELDFYGTDPRLKDTDLDGINDGEELAYWRINWGRDYDGDGLNSLVDSDSDNDGALDGTEITFGFDPADPLSFPTSIIVYEDAEDGTVSGWDVYDDDPPGAVISNVFDSGRQSRVIQFTGSGHSNGYRLRNDDLSKWKNTSQFVLEWSVKFSEFFTVYIEIETTVGRRYLTYRPLNYDSLGDGRYVYYGLGSSAADGQWHIFVRDLQFDLEAAQPGASIVEVNSFMIRGNGSVDDIALRSY